MRKRSQPSSGRRKLCQKAPKPVLNDIPPSGEDSISPFSGRKNHHRSWLSWQRRQGQPFQEAILDAGPVQSLTKPCGFAKSAAVHREQVEPSLCGSPNTAYSVCSRRLTTCYLREGCDPGRVLLWFRSAPRTWDMTTGSVPNSVGYCWRSLVRCRCSMTCTEAPQFRLR